MHMGLNKRMRSTPVTTQKSIIRDWQLQQEVACTATVTLSIHPITWEPAAVVPLQIRAVPALVNA